MNNQNSNINSQKIINEILKKNGENKNLKNGLETGNVEEILAGLEPARAAQLKNLLANPTATETLLNSPQAKALLKALFGGNNNG